VCAEFIFPIRRRRRVEKEAETHGNPIHSYLDLRRRCQDYKFNKV